jgi:putative hemolysin
MNSIKKERPFKLNGSLGLNKIPLLEPLIERSLTLHRLDRMYRNLPEVEDANEFLQQTLDAFNISYQTDSEALRHIPEEGPAVMVANHPFGAIEGVIMAHLLLRRRSDIKIMANHYLQRIPELRELFIGVDPFGGDRATKGNSRPLREAVRWVRNGGLLLVFPAGEVSHYRFDKGRITDPEWSDTIARLIRMTSAPVIPSYIHGNNGMLFQLAGMLHPRLRTALIPRQLTNKAGYSIPIRIGGLIKSNRVSSMAETDSELAKQLRLRCYMLGEQLRQSEKITQTSSETSMLPVAPQTYSASDLENEIAVLPAGQHLVDNNDLQVYYARANQIPCLMQEIGREREITFRETGEGTGRERDIDLYDAYYIHLFIWNREKSELVGAYRLGRADRILERFGKKGLYTHSLFKYRRALLNRLNPALELGRSFIRKEYQRSFAPLLLLWKGIGAYVCKNPQYRVLFGPVSISSEYQTLSQQMIVTFLESNRYLPGLANQIKPRRPFRNGRDNRLRDEVSDLRELDLLSDLVSQIEPDQKGVPILLKQYLKMGGHILGFNVDPDFNNTLDGLIMVDLLQSPEKLLQRYMGEEGAKAFLAYHQAGNRVSRAS